MRLLALMSFGLMVMSSAYAAEYYLSPDGDDDAAGTREAPWGTLREANERLQPGDTLTFLDGEYEWSISPANSGEEGAPITYRAQNSQRAILRGIDTRRAIAMEDREHVVVEGFRVEPMEGSGWMQLTRTRYITIRDCTFEETTGFIIGCEDSHHNRYEGNRIMRSLRLNQWGHTGGDMWNNLNCSRNVFEGNYFSRCGHRPLGFLYESPYNVVRGNVFDGRWGRNFEFFSTPRMLIEGNVITNGFMGSGSADGRAKLFIIDSIFRRNVIHRNWYMPLVINSYFYEGFGEPFGMIDSRLYNNTWYRNHDGAFQMVDIVGGDWEREHYVAGNTFLNNIMYDNDPAGQHLALRIHENIADDNRWLSNTICGDEPGRGVIRYDDSYPRAADWPGASMTVAEAEESRPDQFSGNLDADPRFVNADEDDYRLAADSPAIDAGRPLTRTTSAGSGQVISVEDARWFYDGFGIRGERGDVIWVGDEREPARVLRRDLEANTLTVDHSLTWEAGDPVTLPYAGDAPDHGAWERGAKEGWHVEPVIPDGLRVPTMRTATEPIVVISFEEEDLEQWHWFFSFSRQRNTDSRVDDTTAHTGSRSMRVYATGDDATLSCHMLPRWWDIDRFPYVRLAYRIPEGVPVGIQLQQFPTDGRGLGAVYIAGSAAHDPGGLPQLGEGNLIDDDQWHEITLDVRQIREVYPDASTLKMLRFYTNSNGAEGQQFWWDDFAILPAEDIR